LVGGLFLISACCRLRTTEGEPLRTKGHTPDRIATRFGRIVASVGDCDGDGTCDYAVATPGVNQGCGAVRVFSGMSHAAIFEIAGPADSDCFGQAGFWRLNDVDGDGVDELAVSMGRAGEISRVVSIGRRRSLFTVRAPCDLLIACLDLNDDGGRDLLAASSQGLVAFSGADGNPIDSSRVPELSGTMRPIKMRLGKNHAIIIALVFDLPSRISFFDLCASLKEPLQSVDFDHLPTLMARLACSPPDSA